MEIFNSNRWLGLNLLIISTVMCFSLAGCESTDVPILASADEVKSKFCEIVVLQTGETIVLTDTTTYKIEVADIDACNSIADIATEDMFDINTRSVNSFRAEGYDSLEPEGDWKKYYLGSSWEKYGVTPAIYVARYVNVHKNLSVEPGTYVVPAKYDSESAPKNAMGWKGTTQDIGFTPSPKTNYITDGISRIFIINCDMSGRVYNKNIPADPVNFIWAYKLEQEEDIWD